MVCGALPSGLSALAPALVECTPGASKEKMRWGILPSVMVKSSFARPETTGWPFLSSTVTSRNTSFEVTCRVVVGEGGACDWLCAAAAAHRIAAIPTAPHQKRTLCMVGPLSTGAQARPFLLTHDPAGKTPGTQAGRETVLDRRLAGGRYHGPPWAKSFVGACFPRPLSDSKRSSPECSGGSTAW